MKKTLHKDTTPKGKRKMRSFEPDDDVEQMLINAADSGAVITEITNEALRQYGPEILREHVKKLREKADAIEKSISSGKR